MLLCDIGNTSYHFLQNEEEYKKDAKTFDPSSIKEKVFYICVNPAVKLLLEKLDNWINIAAFIDMRNYYETMGIDRIVACEYIHDGVIVDVGSAITVDLVKAGLFEGGFIYPGIKAMSQTYKNISSALDYAFNFELDLGKMPKNSADALSYGYIKTLVCEVNSLGLEVHLTGGDAKKFAKVFPNAKVDERLIFKSMKQIIKKAKLC
ncbi:MAG: type III pantothenate kinase [Sulfurimonas sp.]|nr:type III pantothenate kinase [Sulfurimonas sp.]MBU1217496.1 type III pantothenate kinase [bacterium]MBU1433762.1 type III pantothenate kinase [bacterium]MBU1503837.1 type III pantothenate kinase [bacterium]MBU3939117.1 type III pantothenate kinase [bacterium]